MNLSLVQKREMYEKGYVRFPGCIPQLMVREALRAINHNIITNGIPPDQLPKFHAQSFCPDLQASPYITGLFNDTPLKAAAEAFLGAGKVPKATGGQMALRFPSYVDPPTVGGPHIDGMYSPTNGVTKGEIQHFSALAAVFLSDTSQPFCGNFSVWPGTHRMFGEHFREHGPKTLLDGMPKVKMPEPEQVLAQPGDAVITHYTLAHSVAANVSPNVRYAIFFRIWREGHKALGFDTMSNIWAEWPGMADALPEAERERAKSLGAY